MTEPHWKNLPSGPQLRRVIAERLGWHLRKIWVGSAGVEYDLLIYDNDDRLAYQREITAAELENEAAAIDETWSAAMEDENCPRWDEDAVEALDLAFGMAHQISQDGDTIRVWVKSAEFSGEAETKALAAVRAWLAATENDPAYFH